jgi:hypothetical protein
MKIFGCGSALFSGIALALAVISIPRAFAGAQSPAPSASNAASVIPPIVLQGCSQKIRAKHSSIFANAAGLSGASHGDQILGFDLSFVNTTSKTAKIVMIRIGDTEFAKVGTFSPGAVIAWRISAHAGDCSIRAVRFDDGTEWSAPPTPATMTTP